MIVGCYTVIFPLNRRQIFALIQGTKEKTRKSASMAYPKNYVRGSRERKKSVRCPAPFEPFFAQFRWLQPNGFHQERNFAFNAENTKSIFVVSVDSLFAQRQSPLMNANQLIPEQTQTIVLFSRCQLTSSSDKVERRRRKNHSSSLMVKMEPFSIKDKDGSAIRLIIEGRNEDGSSWCLIPQEGSVVNEGKKALQKAQGEGTSRENTEKKNFLAGAFNATPKKMAPFSSGTDFWEFRLHEDSRVRVGSLWP